MRRLIRNSIVSVVCSVVVVLFFGWLVNDQYAGYLHAPSFPLRYVVTTPCLTGAILGPCIGSYTYLAVPAAADFVLWFAVVFAGFLVTVSLLTASGSRVRRLTGLAIVGAILCVTFVPIVNTSSHNECGPPPSYCGAVTEYASLSYIFLGTGAIYLTTGDYRIDVARST